MWWHPRRLIAALSPRPFQRRAARLLLIGGGVAMVTASSVFLLNQGGERPPAATAAGPAYVAAGFFGDSASLEAALDAAPTAMPTPTPTYSPTPTSTPTEVPPTATPVPAPPQAPVVPPAPAEPSPAPAEAPPPPPAAPVAAMNAMEQGLFDRINALRVERGLGPLAVDGALVDLARARSADMASRNYFSHTTPEGVNVFDMMAQRGINYLYAGENLARNNYPEAETVQVAFDSLAASPPHLENMLGANYLRMGIGMAYNGAGMYYFTILLIG